MCSSSVVEDIGLVIYNYTTIMHETSNSLIAISLFRYALLNLDC